MEGWGGAIINRQPVKGTIKTARTDTAYSSSKCDPDKQMRTRILAANAITARPHRVECL